MLVDGLQRQSMSEGIRHVLPVRYCTRLVIVAEGIVCKPLSVELLKCLHYGFGPSNTVLLQSIYKLLLVVSLDLSTHGDAG